jgi:myo-inositol-1(or 4)-monophosphatase
MMRSQGVRRTGAAALDLCYVASGRVDGFWEFGLKPWDIAAGALIIEEARGRVGNMDGSALDLEGANILASNGKLHQQMIEVIAEARPEAERRHAAMLAEERQSQSEPQRVAARGS